MSDWELKAVRTVRSLAERIIDDEVPPWAPEKLNEALGEMQVTSRDPRALTILLETQIRSAVGALRVSVAGIYAMPVDGEGDTIEVDDETATHVMNRAADELYPYLRIAMRDAARTIGANVELSLEHPGRQNAE